MAKVYIECSGGLVQNVFSNEEIEVVVIDHDVVQGGDITEIYELDQKIAQLKYDREDNNYFMVW